MHWVVSEARSDNASDRVSGGIGDAAGATLGAVAAGRLLLGGLMAWMACRMARRALVAPCRGGPALHWDNIPEWTGKRRQIWVYKCGTVTT